MKRLIGALLLTLCLVMAALYAGPLHAAALPAVERLPAQLTDDQVAARIAVIKTAAQPLRSTFNDANGDWDIESDEDVQRSFGPGVYHLRVDAASTVAWSSGPDAAANFYVEVDVYHVAGPQDNEFGILFRNDGDNYYVYNVSSDGYYRLHKWVDGEWESVVDWAESTAIVTGEGSHNRLGLLAEGSEISLLINDEVLATVTDDSISGDGLALSAGTFDEGGVEIAFDDFTLWPLGDRTTEEPVSTPATEETPEAITTEEATPEEATPEIGETPEAATTEEAVTPESVTTPEAVATPTATLDPELVQTLVEPIRGNTPDYTDDFRRTSDRWPTVEDDDGVIAFANRGLNIQIDTPNLSLWTSNQEVAALNAGDMLVEADVTRNAGAFDSTYGLLVRFVDNDNYYYFGVSAAGTYSFWRVAAGEWTKLVDWTASDAVATDEGATNRLSVLAQGDRFLLLVNDTPLTEAADDTFAAGGVGVYAGVYAEAGLDVTFDNLDVWVLSEGEAALPVDTEALAAAQERADEVRTGAATYNTRFGRDDGAWSLGEDDNAAIAIRRGALAVDVNQPQWLAWAANEAVVTDFQLETDIALADSSLPGEAGLVFRSQDPDNFYFLAIDNTGRYSLWKKQAGEWQTLIPWSKSDALDTGDGAQNTLGVLAEGSELVVLVNEQAVATASDDSFAAGSLALAVGTFEAPGVSATFDNLRLWNLEE